MTTEVTTFALKFDFILDLASDLWPVVYPLGVSFPGCLYNIKRP